MPQERSLNPRHGPRELLDFVGTDPTPHHTCESCGCVWFVQDEGPGGRVYLDRYEPARDPDHMDCGCHGLEGEYPSAEIDWNTGPYQRQGAVGQDRPRGLNPKTPQTDDPYEDTPGLEQLSEHQQPSVGICNDCGCLFLSFDEPEKDKPGVRHLDRYQPQTEGWEHETDESGCDCHAIPSEQPLLPGHGKNPWWHESSQPGPSGAGAYDVSDINADEDQTDSNADLIRDVDQLRQDEYRADLGDRRRELAQYPDHAMTTQASLGPAGMIDGWDDEDARRLLAREAP